MKKLSFFLMAMLISVMSFADTYTHTFKSGELKVGTVTLNGISWTGEGTVPYWGFDSKDGRGIQIGSKNNPSTAYSLTTSDFEGKITEVVVNASMASSGTAKLSISVGGTSYLSNKALTTTATNYTATGEASGDLVISFTNTAKAFYIKSISVTYVVEENPDAVKYTVSANVNDPAMGTVSGAGEYEEGKTATLTAVPNPAYKFVNWSTGSTANPLKITVTENVEVTANFEAIPPMTCAEAAATADGTTVVLKPFDVVAVVKGAGYTYIKDDSGVNLIFDYTMDDQFKAGDHVEGFVGVSSPYKGLPELKPSVAFADLTVTPGTAPEPTLFTEVPTKADLNKYVKFENVTLTANATFTTESATNATMVVNGTNVTLRNTFKLAATLSKDKAYNIVGFAAIYNSTIQVYFLSAEEYVAPVVNHTITVSANPAEAGTVTGAGEYEEGATATLTATANEGYEFVNWTENEVEVSTDAEYTFEVLADHALVANFKEAEPEIESTWTVAGAPIFDAHWDPAAEKNDMTLQEDGTYKWEKSDLELAANTSIEFKVVKDHKWGEEYPSANYNLSVDEDGIYTITIIFDPTSKEVTAVAIKTGDAEINVTISYVLMGVAGDWTTGITLTQNPENVNEYVLLGQPINEGDAVKVVTLTDGVATAWCGNVDQWSVEHEKDNMDNIILAPGKYDFYFKVLDNLIYIGKTVEPEVPTALDNIDSTVAPVKAIVNGQLIIIKNGVQYNAQGQVVK